MGIQVDVTDGTITPAGSELTSGTSFEWVNNTNVAVNLASCGNWCTPDSCTVEPNGGTVSAQVLTKPNANAFAFRDSGWDAPGMPHIIVTPMPKKEREVA
jgi:hypothetical protein